MSGVSGSTAISIYLSTVKDEQTQVARYVKSDPTLAATAAKFTRTAPTLTTPTAILKNYSALQVLTGAYDIGGDINETAVLKDLITQNVNSSSSLVQKSANTDFLHFARATNDRTSQTAALGSSDTLSLTTGGSYASSLTVQNTAFSLASTAQTAALPGVKWSFVLNDGSANSSVATALDNAVDTTDPGAYYGVSASGQAVEATMPPRPSTTQHASARCGMNGASTSTRISAASPKARASAPCGATGASTAPNAADSWFARS